MALAGGHLADGIDHFVHRRPLGYVADSARLHQPARKGFFVTHRNRYHLDVAVILEQFPCSYQTADARHAYIHQYHIRTTFPRRTDSSVAAAAFAHYRQPGHITEHPGYAHAYQVVIINHQYLDQIKPLS